MENAKCAFCFQCFRQSDEVYVTNCGHKYHRFCISCCLDRSEICYKCDQRVTRTDIQRDRIPSNNEEQINRLQTTQLELVKALSDLRLEMQEKERKHLQIQMELAELKNDAIRERTFDDSGAVGGYNKKTLNLVCVICTELFTPTNNVLVTICGHMFHHACLCKWLEVSESCPQCREKCSHNNTIKVYLSLDTNENNIETLQEQLNYTNLKLRAAEEQIKSMKVTIDQEAKFKASGGRDLKFK